MSYYTNQDLDFVVRTKEIIKQYNTIFKEKNKQFEITLFLNCFVGLLIIPQQRLFKSLPKKPIDNSNNDWGIIPEDIEIIKDERKSISNIARHLRNSLSHYRFIANPDNQEISSISFEDKLLDNETISFKLTITVENLKVFVNRFADYYIDKISK